MVNLKKFTKYMRTSNKEERLCANDGKSYYMGTYQLLAKFEAVDATVLGAIVEIFGKLPGADKVLRRPGYKEKDEVSETNVSASLVSICSPKQYEQDISYTHLIQMPEDNEHPPVDVYTDKKQYIFINTLLTAMLLDKNTGCICANKSGVLFRGENEAICLAVYKNIDPKKYLKELREGNKNGN